MGKIGPGERKPTPISNTSSILAALLESGTRMRTSKPVLRTAAALLAVALLCGCGKKGRLYIPAPQDEIAPLSSLTPVSLRR